MMREGVGKQENERLIKNIFGIKNCSCLLPFFVVMLKRAFVGFAFHSFSKRRLRREHGSRPILSQS